MRRSADCDDEVAVVVARLQPVDAPAEAADIMRLVSEGKASWSGAKPQGAARPVQLTRACDASPATSPNGMACAGSTACRLACWLSLVGDTAGEVEFSSFDARLTRAAAAATRAGRRARR